MLNIYLHGNFAPVQDELDVVDLPVHGDLPRWLQGTFVRNGANARLVPKGRHSRIDGDGMLHAVSFDREGRACYRNRFVRTWGLAREIEAGRPLWNGLLQGPDPASPPLPAGQSVYKNTANTSVVAHAGRVLAMYEGGLPHAVDPATLETLGLHDFGGTWERPFIAHPKVDAATGEMMFVSSHVPSADLRYGVVGRDGRVSHSVKVATDIGLIMHDMAITERYSVIFALPYTFDRARVAAGRSPWDFERERPSRFGVIARHGTEVQWFEAPASFIFHTLNAYEEGDEIVLHAPRLESTEWLHRAVTFGRRPGEVRGGDWAGRMHEWRMNLRTGVLRERPMDDVFVDFPQLPPALVGRKHRYGYSVRLAEQTGDEPTLFNGIVKHDFARGTQSFAAFGPECFGHECAFVPRPGAPGVAEEDDGVLVTFMHDEFACRSEVVVYDARTLERMARVPLPRRVPYGFHGTWLPATS